VRKCDEPKATLIGHSLWVSALVFSKDGVQLFSAGGDRTLKIWDVPTQQERYTFKGHTGGVTSLALSPDQKTLVSGGRDSTVRLWRAATEKEVRAAVW
jgi:WD40 repeat protein